MDDIIQYLRNEALDACVIFFINGILSRYVELPNRIRDLLHKLVYEQGPRPSWHRIYDVYDHWYVKLPVCYVVVPLLVYIFLRFFLQIIG